MSWRRIGTLPTGRNLHCTSGRQRTPGGRVISVISVPCHRGRPEVGRDCGPDRLSSAGARAALEAAGHQVNLAEIHPPGWSLPVSELAEMAIPVRPEDV